MMHPSIHYVTFLYTQRVFLYGNDAIKCDKVVFCYVIKCAFFEPTNDDFFSFIKVMFKMIIYLKFETFYE